jgi:UDP-N-acetyl-D-mannosaminuronic acid transferase (WecB/TagA/CpsF family)
VTTPQRVEVLGLPVDLVKLEDALASVDARIQAWRTAPSEPLMQIVTVNAEMAIQALRSPDLRAVFERSALVVRSGRLWRVWVSGSLGAGGGGRWVWCTCSPPMN